MARMPFDPPGSQPGKQYDNSHFGGYGNVIGGTDAQGIPIITGSGRQDAVNRYRGLGEAAAARDAYKVDFERAKADQARGLAVRGNQMEAARMLGNAAHGGAPSAANVMGGQVAGQSLDGALAAGAGARGGLAQQAAAQRAGATQQAGMQLGGVNQYAAMRAGELGDARSAYLGGVTGIRNQDFQSQGLAAQQAEAQAQAENFQRGLNQEGQMAFEQRGFDVNALELERALRQKQIYAGQFAANAARQQANKEAQMGFIGNVVGGIGTVGAGVMDADSRTPAPKKPGGT